MDFDPVYRVGWRGPYVVANNGSVYTINATTDFLEQYGENGDPAVLDGWGNPIVIQNPGLTSDGGQDVRLVSAGPNGIVDINPTTPTAALLATRVWRATTFGFRLNCDKGMMKRSGMTLVELLVVLAILALLTTVAVTSSDVVLSQGRYEATTRTLTDIQEAVLGPPNARQADGTLVSTGFVADMGRLAAV